MREADPERALACRRGMVLEERRFIRDNVEEQYYDEQVTATVTITERK